MPIDRQPPSLAWLKPFCDSLSGAIGQTVSGQYISTVNPLVYNVSLSWSEPLTGKSRLSLWNLFQIWAAKNQCVVVGKGEPAPNKFVVAIGLKERLGKERKNHPLG